MGLEKGIGVKLAMTKFLGGELLPADAQSENWADAMHDNSECCEEPSSISKYIRPIYFVSNDPLDGSLLFEYVRTNGREIVPLGASLFRKFYSEILAIRLGALVICIDDFGGIAPIYGRLRDIRDFRPKLPVIIMSKIFKSDDLTQERLAICDISIKLPLSPENFEQYFSKAIINNRAWANRLAEMQSEREELAMKLTG